ncbi:MAG: M15 family metallopeptidase [Blautia sp.]|nr:M15 family metallopeptidase [Blautia sp.]
MDLIRKKKQLLKKKKAASPKAVASSKKEREQELQKRLLILTACVAGALVLVLLSLLIGGGIRKKAENAALVADDSDLVDMIPTQNTAAGLYADKPNIDINSWEYILANYNHNIEEYEPIIDYVDGMPMDYRVVEPMANFIQAARNQGLNVVLASAYRDYEEQSWLFELQKEMMSEAEAETVVARPGTSEHQTGLAADITDDDYDIKTQDLENTALYQWMSAHCHEYGFIVRFPKDKEEITRIIYEPWHFRYVGVEAASYIMKHGLCLEEFIELYQ